jgi:hypothetical protein
MIFRPGVNGFPPEGNRLPRRQNGFSSAGKRFSGFLMVFRVLKRSWLFLGKISRKNESPSFD